MPINREKYHQSATRKHVGRTTIILSVALEKIAEELERIRNDEKPTVEGVAEIKKAADELEAHWDILAGWTPNE